jgi:hypothetical protein
VIKDSKVHPFASSRTWKTIFVSLAIAASISCKAPAVSGFAWTDGSGGPLKFTQASAWPAGQEGRFAASKKSNRYVLEKAITVDPSRAVEVRVARAAASPDARGGLGVDSTRIRLSLSPETDGSSPLSTATFPLLEEEARFILNVDAAARLASLAVESQEGGSPFEIESIGIVPSFKGIDHGHGALRVSSDFDLSIGKGYRELSIRSPFAGADAGKGDASGARLGLLLEYGKASKPSSMDLTARMKDGSEGRFRLRTHPSGARTVLDESIVPMEAESLTLKTTDDQEISAFYAASLPQEEYRLADLGRVIRSEADGSDYKMYRWDMLPSVLVFDFKDYATQDRYLKRVAFFVEKAGYRGVLATDEAMAPLHGWNAHDYRAEDMAAFFQAAKEKNFPLGPEERALEGILEEAGTLRESGGRIEAGTGALISISRESSDALRWTFAVHESTHGIFFADPQYRDFVRSLWASIGPEEKWFWKTYFGWAAYDVQSDYLMGNEFQAYLLQQPKEMAEEYFSKRKSDELLEKHPELKPRVEQYMAKYGKTFAQRAGQLEAWLYSRYGVEAGRTVCLTKAR